MLGGYSADIVEIVVCAGLPWPSALRKISPSAGSLYCELRGSDVLTPHDRNRPGSSRSWRAAFACSPPLPPPVSSPACGRRAGAPERCGSSLGAVAVLYASIAIEVVAEQAFGLGLIAAGAVIGLGLGAGLYWLASAAKGVQEELRDAALSYMTQGLCMFDAPGRLVFWNKRFAEIYRVEGRLRIGFTLRDILRERIAVGTLAEDPDEYARRATAAAKAGKKFTHVFELSDGRKIAVNNEPRPSGGWVSTHDDITERLQVAQERAAIRDQEQRRTVVDSAIATFRPQMENLIGSVTGNASTMRGTASSLFDSFAADLAARRGRGALLRRGLGQRQDRRGGGRRAVAARSPTSATS